MENVSVQSTDLAETKPEFCQIDLETDTLLKNEEFKAISGYFVYDETGNRISIAELSAEFKTIFIFVRSFLCFTSKEYVEDLALIPREYFKEKQVRLVVIGCAHWKHIKAFRNITKFPYFLFCDIDYDIYNRLGFNRSSDLGRPGSSYHVKSSNWSGLFKSAKRAISSNTDAFDYQGRWDQQGGCLIAGPGPFIHFFYKDKDARDHMQINSILNKVGIHPVYFNNTKTI